MSLPIMSLPYIPCVSRKEGSAGGSGLELGYGNALVGTAFLSSFTCVGLSTCKASISGNSHLDRWLMAEGHDYWTVGLDIE